jgi:hypothetical protein
MCQGSKNFWSAFQEEEILWEFHGEEALWVVKSDTARSDPLKTPGSFVIPREIYHHEVFREKTLFWEFHGSFGYGHVIQSRFRADQKIFLD